MTVLEKIRTMGADDLGALLCQIKVNDCIDCPFYKNCPSKSWRTWLATEWKDCYYGDGGLSSYKGD